MLHTGKSFLGVSADWLGRNEPFLKESTIVKYRNLLSLYLVPEFGEYNIEEITTDHVANMCNKLRVSGGMHRHGLSPKTVSDILSLLKNILKYAQNNGMPVSFTSYSIPFRSGEKQLRVFSMGEQKTLVEYLSSNVTRKNLGIMLCLFTGIRVGELCALKCDDISIAESTIYIHQTMQRIQSKEGKSKTKITITAPKSECSIQVIPLPEILVQPIAEKHQDGTFFLTGNSENFIEPRTMQNHFKSVLKACGIENVNFHVLRHTFATRCGSGV